MKTYFFEKQFPRTYLYTSDGWHFFSYYYGCMHPIGTCAAGMKCGQQLFIQYRCLQSVESSDSEKKLRETTTRTLVVQFLLIASKGLGRSNDAYLLTNLNTPALSRIFKPPHTLRSGDAAHMVVLCLTHRVRSCAAT